MPPWTGRLTSSGSSTIGPGFSPLPTAASCSALAFASSIALSKAMALSTAGSPIVFNMPKASSPAKKPTIIPRHNKDPVVITIILNANSRRRALRSQAKASTRPRAAAAANPLAGVQIHRLVAGEAEEMAAVVHKFMHIHALDDRSRALLRADEIDAEQANEAAENDPGKHFANWDRSGPCGGGSKCRSGHVDLLGIWRPRSSNASSRNVSDSRSKDRSQWRDRAGLAPASIRDAPLHHTTVGGGVNRTLRHYKRSKAANVAARRARGSGVPALAP